MKRILLTIALLSTLGCMDQYRPLHLHNTTTPTPPTNERLYVSIQGQSNALGTGGNPVLSVDQGHLRVDVAGTSFDNLIPLANLELTEQCLSEDMGVATSQQVIVDTNANSNQSILSLKKGTANYNAALLDRNNAYLIAAGLGWTINDYGMVWIQGERDEKDAMPRTQYRDELIQLAADWFADTGTTITIVQLASWTQSGGSAANIVIPTVVLAQYDAYKASPYIKLSHPSYSQTHTSGGLNVHFDNNGHCDNGKMFAKAILDASWSPLEPTGVTVLDPSTIEVSYNHNLVVDTTNFPAKPNLGFTALDDLGVLPISSAALGGANFVQISFSRPASTNPVIQYGLDTVDDAPVGPVDPTSPGGNLRTVDNKWSVIFDQAF